MKRDGNFVGDDSVTIILNPVQVGTEIGFGGFYGGDLTFVMTFLSRTGWNGHLQFELENVNDFGDLSSGSVVKLS